MSPDKQVLWREVGPLFVFPSDAYYTRSSSFLPAICCANGGKGTEPLATLGQSIAATIRHKNWRG